MDKIRSRISAGVESSSNPGVLEQWLREGKITEREAITESLSLFGAGVDTVSIVLC